MLQQVSRTFQARRALLRHLAPRYQQASSAQKTLLLDSFVEQVDPLALSEYLDVLRHALLRGTQTTAADGEGEFVLPLLRFSLVACTSGPQSVSEEGPA
jgi:hypothetical protein